MGRQDEFRLVLHAATAPPSLVLVEGEAGIGKTRLVAELLADPALEARRVLVGRCHPLREPFPLGPVIEALRNAGGELPRGLSPVVGALRPLLPELAAQLPQALEPLGDARADRHRLFRAILALLDSFGPAVCVLEDLHWIDEGTHELLGFLASQLPSQLSVVLTYRPDEVSASSPLGSLASRLPPGTSSARVSLVPLDLDELRQLIAGILETEHVSDEFVSYLHERTEGVPFAVEEVLRLLADRRDIVVRDDRWARRTLARLEVPAAIRDSVLERFAHLSDEARAIGQAGAVLGVPARDELLAAVARVPARRATDALSEALASGLLHELGDGSYEFRHSLAAQAVYDGLPSPERRELHLRAARALEPGEDPPLVQLARHYKCANSREDWLRYAEAAADRLIALGDEAAAVELLQEVLAENDLPPALRGRAAVKLGRASLSGFAHTETIAQLRRALDDSSLAGSARGEARLYLGLLLENQAGNRTAGDAEIERAVEDLGAEPTLRVRALAALAQPMKTTGHLDDHLNWLSQMTEAATLAADTSLMRAVRGYRAGVLMLIGDPRRDQALREVDHEASSGAERRLLARVHGNTAYAACFLGHHELARSSLDRALSLARETDDVYVVSGSEATSLIFDYVAGRWEGLARRAERVLAASSDLPTVAGAAALVLGLVLLGRGELARAESELTSALERSLQTGSIPNAAWAAAGRSRILLARGDPEGARSTTGEMLDVIRRKGIWVWASDLATAAVEALLAAGRRGEAEQLVAELARGLRGKRAPAGSAALMSCRGLVAPPSGEEAARAFAGAHRAWAKLPRPYDAALALEAQGRSSLGATHENGDPVLRALEMYEQLGATWDTARARATLRERGLVPASRAGRKGYGDRLSPREREVAELASVGRTNREIATELYVSPRTVEDHMASAMRKLGVRSRGDLRSDELKERIRSAPSS